MRKLWRDTASVPIATIATLGYTTYSLFNMCNRPRYIEKGMYVQHLKMKAQCTFFGILLGAACYRAWKSSNFPKEQNKPFKIQSVTPWN